LWHAQHDHRAAFVMQGICRQTASAGYPPSSVGSSVPVLKRGV